MMRQGLGMPDLADARAGTTPAPMDEATLDALLLDRRPPFGSAAALAGIVVTTWLMETKPL